MFLESLCRRGGSEEWETIALLTKWCLEKRFFLGGGPGHGKLVKHTHQKAARNPSESRIRAVQCYDCPAVVDITGSEDKLNLIPGNAVGSATPVGIPVCYWSTRKTEAQ